MAGIRILLIEYFSGNYRYTSQIEDIIRILLIDDLLLLGIFLLGLGHYREWDFSILSSDYS